MPLLRWSTLPNAITVARILMAPAIFFLIFAPGLGSRVLTFAAFIFAAFSDLWDGHLARKHGWISDFGRLVDPVADKLLILATIIPIYVLSHRDVPVGSLPFIGPLPLWIVLVILGREALITGVRTFAARRGTVIPAGHTGKYKTVFQNIFVGAMLVWYVLQRAAIDMRWSGFLWERWQVFHGTVVLATLVLAVGLTLLSMGIYLWQWRRLLHDAP